jgi:hypothetical protein
MKVGPVSFGRTQQFEFASRFFQRENYPVLSTHNRNNFEWRGTYRMMENKPKKIY